jgi:hypothetical protein
MVDWRARRRRLSSCSVAAACHVQKKVPSLAVDGISVCSMVVLSLGRRAFQSFSSISLRHRSCGISAYMLRACSATRGTAEPSPSSITRCDVLSTHQSACVMPGITRRSVVRAEMTDSTNAVCRSRARVISSVVVSCASLHKRRYPCMEGAFAAACWHAMMRLISTATCSPTCPISSASSNASCRTGRKDGGPMSGCLSTQACLRSFVRVGIPTSPCASPVRISLKPVTESSHFS